VTVYLKKKTHLPILFELGAALLERRPSGHAASCNGKFSY
jgi:hypothetical protein